jgi:hypothetical protein
VIDDVLRHFGTDASRRIGHGGEATVYAIGDDRVLRIFHEPRAELEYLAAFYDEIAGTPLPFALPRVIDHSVMDGVAYSVDARIPGRPLMDAMLEMRGERRRRALDSYLLAAEQIASITMKRPYFGEVVRDRPVRADTWREFLHARIDRSLETMRVHLEADVPSSPTRWRACDGGSTRCPRTC